MAIIGPSARVTKVTGVTKVARGSEEICGKEILSQYEFYNLKRRRPGCLSTPGPDSPLHPERTSDLCREYSG